MDASKPSVLMRIIAVVSVLYGAGDVLTALAALVIILLFADPGVGLEAGFDEWRRLPMALLLLAGGLGLFFDKPWSRYVYWLLPVYPLVVTLFLLPMLLGPLPGADLGAVLYALAWYWPASAVFLCVVAYLVTRHFKEPKA